MPARTFAPRVDMYVMRFPVKRRPGIRLKLFRIGIGLSQRLFGEVFGVKRGTISSIELGHSSISPRMLRGLYDKWGLSTDSILYDGEPLDGRVIQGYDSLKIKILSGNGVK